MSKQSEAKLAQGYRKKPDTCSNCKHMQFEVIEKSYTRWNGAVEVWEEEKAHRCSVGGFAVKKTSTCRIHALKEGGAA